MAQVKKAAPRKAPALKVTPMPDLGLLQQAILDAAQHLRDCKEARDNAVIAQQEAFIQCKDLDRQLENALVQLAAAAIVPDGKFE